MHPRNLTLLNYVTITLLSLLSVFSVDSFNLISVFAEIPFFCHLLLTQIFVVIIITKFNLFSSNVVFVTLVHRICMHCDKMDTSCNSKQNNDEYFILFSECEHIVCVRVFIIVILCSSHTSFRFIGEKSFLCRVYLSF